MGYHVCKQVKIEQQNLLVIPLGNSYTLQNVTTPVVSYDVSVKHSSEITLDPDWTSFDSLPVIYPIDTPAHIQNKVCTQLFTAALFVTASNWTG